MLRNYKILFFSLIILSLIAYIFVIKSENTNNKLTIQNNELIIESQKKVIDSLKSEVDELKGTVDFRDKTISAISKQAEEQSKIVEANQLQVEELYKYELDECRKQLLSNEMDTKTSDQPVTKNKTPLTIRGNNDSLIKIRNSIYNKYITD